MERRSVAIVGATGIAGQQFIACLQDHPWLRIGALAASERSAGRPYREAISGPGGAFDWWCDRPLSEEVAGLVVQDAAHLKAEEFTVVFSAVEADAARALESVYAQSTPVFSTASAFRYEDDVPLVIPGVNYDHLRLIDRQRRGRRWRGFIVPEPNCTTTGLAITLKPLQEAFGVARVAMTSLQGISGAGRSPGVPALDIIDNIIPFIPSEEEKVERETQKILGRVGAGRIEPAALIVSSTCTRVPVLEGHTEVVSAALGRAAAVDEVKEALRAYDPRPAGLDLPSAPRHMILVHEDPYRPQPRRDRDAEDGMATTVGRVRPDPAFENGVKYVLVTHNTKMGAARGALLTAEYCIATGLIP